MTLDDLIKLADAPRRIEAVAVGEKTAWIRGLSAAEVEDAADLAAEDGQDDVRPYLLAMALVNEAGIRLCGDARAHAKTLRGLPAVTARRLYAALDRASDVPSGVLETTAKNSGTRTDGGDTGSPANSAESDGSTPTGS